MFYGWVTSEILFITIVTYLYLNKHKNISKYIYKYLYSYAPSLS